MAAPDPHPVIVIPEEPTIPFLPNTNERNGEINFCSAMRLLKPPHAANFSREDCLFQAITVIRQFPSLASQGFVYHDDDDDDYDLTGKVVKVYKGSKYPLFWLTIHGASADQVQLVYNLNPTAPLKFAMALLHPACSRSALAYLARHFPLQNDHTLVHLVLRMLDPSPHDVLLVQRLVQKNPSCVRTGDMLRFLVRDRVNCHTNILSLLLQHAIRQSKKGPTLDLCGFPQRFQDGYWSREKANGPLNILEEMIVADEELQNICLAFEEVRVLRVDFETPSQFLLAIAKGLRRRKNPVLNIALTKLHLNTIQDLVGLVSAQAGPTVLSLHKCVLVLRVEEEEVGSPTGIESRRPADHYSNLKEFSVDSGCMVTILAFTRLFEALPLIAPDLKRLKFQTNLYRSSRAIDATDPVIGLLRHNRSLESLSLSECLRLDMGRVAEVLQDNTTLRSFVAEPFGVPLYKPIVLLLANQNVTLEKFCRINGDPFSALWKKIKYYTDLNSYGRKFFRDTSATKDDLVQVLNDVPSYLDERALASAFYGLLRENPQVWANPKVVTLAKRKASQEESQGKKQKPV